MQAVGRSELRMEHLGRTRLRVAWFGHASGVRGDGLSTYSAEMVRRLEEKGAHVRFFYHGLDGELVPCEDTVVLPGYRWKTVVIPGKGYLATMEAGMVSFRPHITHASWSFSLADSLVGNMAHRYGGKSVATFHVPSGESGTARGIVMDGLYRYHGRALARFDRCVVLSSRQRSLLAHQGYPRERMLLAPNGVDTAIFSPGPSGLRRRLGASFVVSYVGRLDPEKRVVELIETFARMGWPSDHRLVIAGDGSQQKTLYRRWGKHHGIHFMGNLANRNDRVELLRATDVFVLPSTAEGLSLSLLEAMAAGCAVVATDAGDDGTALGDAGIVLPIAGLDGSLAEALYQLWRDPSLRALFGRRARERAVTRYDIGRHVDEVWSLYRSLAPATVDLQ